MGWSFRKSFKSGPFRINFSNSGVSYSFGVKGARISTSSKGTYVNLSSHGINYRQKIGNTPYQNSPANPVAFPVSNTVVHHIASGNIETLSDTDSREFVSELSEKSNQISFVNWFGLLPLSIVLVVLLAASAKTSTAIIATKADSIIVRVTSPVGVNVREFAKARSEVIKEAVTDETFQLLDSTNSHWLKVSKNGSTGYINKRFAKIEHINRELPEKQVEGQLNKSYILAGILIFFFPLLIWLKRLDKKRFEMELNYEMDEQHSLLYQKLKEYFTELSTSHRIWQYLNSSQTNDYKRNAGAGKLIKRIPAAQVSSHKAPLKYFITNVSIPFIKLQNLELYFLPERLLIKQAGTYAAVFYKNVRITGHLARFIEDESLPRDAKVVDYTWRFVNKHGGPDRRFNNNRQIPICNYSEYTVSSDTGIYEVLSTSKAGAMDNLATFLKQIGALQAKMDIGEFHSIPDKIH